MKLPVLSLLLLVTPILEAAPIPRIMKPMRVLKGHKATITAIVFTPDGKTFATGSVDTFVKLWDAQTGRLKGTFQTTDQRDIRTLAFSSTGKYLAIASPYEVEILDIVTGRKLPLKNNRESCVITCVAFLSNDQVLAVSHHGGAGIDLRALNDKNFTKIKRIPIGMPDKVEVSPNGKWIACDYDVEVWEVATGKRRISVETKESVTAIKFCPDNKTLATASCLMDERRKKFLGGSITLWNLASGKKKATLLGHNDDITCIDFSPDGRMMVTGSLHYGKDEAHDSGEIILWDLVSLKRKYRARLVGSGISRVAFSPSGKFFVSGNEYGEVRVWRVESFR